MSVEQLVSTSNQIYSFADERLQPSLHTGLGVNGHAHPSPTAATMSASGTEEERLEELLAGLVFDVELRGLAFSSHAAPQAMHLPRLRKSKSLFQSRLVRVIL